MIDHEPLGTASLAQVHRAKRKSDGLELVLKIPVSGCGRCYRFGYESIQKHAQTDTNGSSNP